MFFRAGVVAHVEDLRDSRLSFLITGFQAVCRWHCAQATKKQSEISRQIWKFLKFWALQLDVKRKHKQISAYRMIQANVRAYLQLRTWVWFKLYRYDENVKDLWGSEFFKIMLRDLEIIVIKKIFWDLEIIENIFTIFRA